MKKLSISLAWLLAVLAACTAPNTPTSSPRVITPSPTPLLSTEEILPIGDGGLITGQPCQSPCFFGIHIGETPLDQVIPLLANYGISSCSMASETTIFCGKETVRLAIGANPATSIVDGIEYDPSIPITVEEIIREYGNPNFIHVSLDVPERSKIAILLLWDSIRMRIDLPEIEEKSCVIESKTRIQSVIFLDETSYAGLTANPYTQPWKGYGTYAP